MHAVILCLFCCIIHYYVDFIGLLSFTASKSYIYYQYSELQCFIHFEIIPSNRKVTECAVIPIIERGIFVEEKPPEKAIKKPRSMRGMVVDVGAFSVPMQGYTRVR